MKAIKYLILFIILVICNNAFAQKQNNQWRFGTAGAVDFNTVPPTFVAGCPISTIEGSASVADRITGALLFYSDGVTVWNANNQVMPNGTGLLGGVTQMSSTTAAVIVPKPGSSRLFYIVTVDEIPFINGVRYSVVDMTLNGGLGDIVVGQKNIFLMQTTSERLEVVPACDGRSLWLIACSINNEFVSFRIDDTGIQATPITSAVFQNGFAGHMKINRQFNKIAIGCCTQIEVFDFDNATGIVSNPIVWNANLPSGLVWGIEFSPDGKVLYASDGTFLLQFDLTQTTPLAIQNSEYQVASFTNVTLQLGIDEKIYVNSGSLSAINSPNNLGIACGYQTNVIANQTGVDLGAGGLPKWVYYANDPPYNIVFNENCFGANTQFFIADTTGISSITWNFGDPNTGTNNTAVGDTAFHTFSQLGIYTIQAILTNACGFDTLSTEVAILNPCNPQDEQCDVFQYTGAVQQWTVPTGVDTIRVKMWGAAGGSGSSPSGNGGGGGGFTEFTMSVVPGDVLEIEVGSGGVRSIENAGGIGGWPSGGAGGTGNRNEVVFGVPSDIGGGGGGGGRSLIRMTGSLNQLLAVAGGGGGAAFDRYGGGGGGLEAEYTAANNTFSVNGFGGTQTAGGAPGNNEFCPPPTLGSSGNAFAGGAGATDLLELNTGGGGGGDGYFGGGGGSSHEGCFGVGSTGGGGSGFICSTCPGLTGTTQTAGFFGEAANSTDPLLASYPGTATGLDGQNGGGGLVQICYTSSNDCLPITLNETRVSCGPYTSNSGVNYSTSGIYTEIFPGPNGCDTTLRINLTVNPVPVVNITTQLSGCDNSSGSATANVSQGSPEYSYVWSPGGGTSATIDSLPVGDYSVIVSDANGCTSSGTGSVGIVAGPQISVLPENATITVGDSIQLSASGGLSYSWSPPDYLSCSDCSSPMASPQVTTIYNVTGFDAAGCFNTALVTITVEERCDEVFIPTIFSPNGKGPQANETFCVFSNCVEQFKLVIHNRWGEKIFESEDISKCWDGTFKGIEVQSGLYAYNLYVRQQNGTVVNKTGTITLVK